MFTTFSFMSVPFPFCQNGITMRVCRILAVYADIDYFPVNLICGISQASTFTRCHILVHIYIFLFHPAPPVLIVVFYVPPNSNTLS